jgi:dipeptidyl aminopeptidase/acylaminoacyl peptidase
MHRTLILALAAVLLAAPAAAQQQVERRTANDGNVVLEGIPELPARLARAADRYTSARTAVLQDWSHDGGVYVTTRFGNVVQLHRVDSPGGARHQLTFFSEPLSQVRRRPGGSDLVFAMDQGGSEFFQLYLMDPATREHRQLTPGGRVRSGGALWSRDGSRLAYASTRRDGRSNDIWVVDPADTATARLAFAAPDGAWYGAADWSADVRSLLFLQYVSVRDSRIHLLDLDSGEARLLAGDAAAPTAHSGTTPMFDRAGRGVFFSTDADGEFLRLAWLELASGRVHPITAGIDWDVEGFAMSDDRRRAAFLVNEGGISRLYLLDPDTRRHRRVEGLPVGIISATEFSPDGRRLAITINSSLTPSDVFGLELGRRPLDHGRLVRWTYSEVGPVDPETFVTPELIEYTSFDGLTVPAFVYRPRGEGPHPVIVQIHGGPESQSRPGFVSLFQMWIQELGAAVISPNVRGSTGYGKTYVALDDGMRREDSVRDIGALLDWIATQPDLDASRVAVYGGSYGGYMVLASMIHFGDRIRAGVNSVGISNFVTFLESTEEYRRDLRRVEYGDERDPEMRAFLEQISPTTNAHRIVSPLFVVQGQNDPRVPVTEAEQIVAAVRANDRPVWYMNALNEGHGFARRENQELMRQAVQLFFEEHLIPVR